MKYTHTIIWAGFTVALLAYYSFASPVSAATGLTVQPIKISHTLEPGESVTGVITVSNKSEKAINLDLAVEDFIPSAGSTNVQFVGRADGNTTVRDWITLDSPKSFVFEKGETHNIRYTIEAPQTAEPGGHFGVIFFKATEIESNSQLKVGTRIGVLTFVTVPGDQLQKGQIQDFSGPFFVQRGPVNFSILFENTGTVHFEPKGNIIIKNIFGKKVGEVVVAGQAVLPTGARTITANWETEGFLLGRYTASVSLVDGEGNELTAEKISFWAFPLWYLIAFLLTVVVLFFVFRFLASRVRIEFKQ